MPCQRPRPLRWMRICPPSTLARRGSTAMMMYVPILCSCACIPLSASFFPHSVSLAVWLSHSQLVRPFHCSWDSMPWANNCLCLCLCTMICSCFSFLPCCTSPSHPLSLGHSLTVGLMFIIILTYLIWCHVARGWWGSWFGRRCVPPTARSDRCLCHCPTFFCYLYLSFWWWYH